MLKNITILNNNSLPVNQILHCFKQEESLAWATPLKKDGERSKGKGRRVGLGGGGRIYSISCSARCFFNSFFQLDRVEIDSAARN